ncbi:MAG: hypothetical protein JXR91_06440 [Deltaproteobacteria bacterium]|nr:hypothetical protein [Deltaproteobacteria bacterium]
MATMKLGCAQMHVNFENIDANLENAKELIFQAKRNKVDTVIFPEMFATGFTLNTKIAQGENDSILRFLKQEAVDNKINIIAGYMSAATLRPFNSAVAIDRKGEIIARYSKINLFKPQNEHNVLSAGGSTVVFDLEGVNISLFICFDLRFPNIYREVAKQSDVMITIAAWPLERQQHFETLLEARAIENQCYSIGVNQVGVCNGVEYGGGSAFISPKGVPLVRKYSDEGIAFANIDTDKVELTRRAFPVLD